jgi:hypothetical protein
VSAEKLSSISRSVSIYVVLILYRLCHVLSTRDWPSYLCDIVVDSKKKQETHSLAGDWSTACLLYVSLLAFYITCFLVAFTIVVPYFVYGSVHLSNFYTSVHSVQNPDSFTKKLVLLP